MRELPFPSVTITTDLGKTKDIESVGVAALWLVAHWPVQTGDKYQAARQACLEAWDEKSLARPAGTPSSRLPKRRAFTSNTSGFSPFLLIRLGL
ncbi:DUF982 domain-containing protein [Phyllobacterium sp. A18/5-2]|uniref:DUF982 domain-containing protein n=1 Tax=Phyllobacterium sp. A18/5-2 TaxID=2978392 RepID=UPI003965ADE1